MKAWHLLLPFILLIPGACSKTEPAKNSQPSAEAPRPVLAVTILPQRYLVRQLLGDPCDILVLVPPGSSPETYTPTPQQMKELAKAVMYVRIGHMELETAWLDKYTSSFPDMRVVDPSRGLKFLAGHSHHHESEEAEADEHGHDDSQHLPGIDPHIWLSAPQMTHYCRNLTPMLIEQFPDRAQTIAANLTRLLEEMERVNQEIRQLLAPHQGKGFMVFHPAWGYFARDYGLLQWAIEDEGKSPSPRHLKEMTDQAKDRGITRIFIQNQFERRNAEALAETLGIKVVELDPLLEAWPTLMMQTARTIAEGFQTP